MLMMIIMARLRAIIINGAAPIIYIVCFDSMYILGNAMRAEVQVTSTAHNGNFSNN